MNEFLQENPDDGYWIPDELLIGVDHNIDPWELTKPDWLVQDPRLTGDLEEGPLRLLLAYSPEDEVITFEREEGHPTQFTSWVVRRLHPPEPSSSYADQEGLVAAIARLNALVQNEENPPDGDVQVLGGVRNWLTSAGMAHIGTGGPGGRPVPPPGKSSFALSQAVQSALGTPDSQTIDVAILDTVPSEATLQAAFGNLAWRDDPLLKSLLWPQGVLDVQRNDFSITRIPCAPFACHSTVGQHRDYDLSDHGLFIAGIIRRIAPNARIHLIQALGDQGVGSVSQIIRAAETVRDLPRNTPLLVNLSFAVNTRQLLTGARGALSSGDQLQVQMENFSLWMLFSLLGLSNARLIAAAGNDNQTTPPRRPARSPADYLAVIGVGALKADLSGPVSYSNTPDQPASFGLWALGGEVRPDGKTDPAKAVQSCFIGSFPDGQANVSGWASWAGTSFATAIVTGTLAKMAGDGLTLAQAESTLRTVGGAVTLPGGSVSQAKAVATTQQMTP